MGIQNLSSEELHEIIDNQALTIDNKTEAFLAYERTWQHIDLVMRLLASAQIELMKRAVTHDRTKLTTPEREMFAEMRTNLRDITYGSPEYKENLKKMLGKALEHHYEHNRHHPEFFESQEEESGEDYDYKKFVDWIVGKDADSDDILEQAEQTSSINKMNLFDLLEMFIDWTAASQRHADGDINRSIEINTDRFALSPQLIEVFKNTIPWVQDAFVGLNTQQDIQPPKQ